LLTVSNVSHHDREGMAEQLTSWQTGSRVTEPLEGDRTYNSKEHTLGHLLPPTRPHFSIVYERFINNSLFKI
jgi:hypothetical protein